eukprot:6093172-Karenia_brevis.AAC.1
MPIASLILLTPIRNHGGIQSDPLQIGSPARLQRAGLTAMETCPFPRGKDSPKSPEPHKSSL